MGRAADTRRRVLESATRLFAERGFRGATLRDVAARASANLASGHYHFGSKRQLYLEVLRRQFGEIRSRLARRGARPSEAELERMSRAELERLLERRIRVMLEVLLGPPPGPQGALLLREMADPSEALPVIVRELIGPMKQEMGEIVARLEPRLRGRDVERCVFSIVGQVLHYRFTMPVVLALTGRRRYGRDFVRETARHVAAFSLGGMARLAAGGGADGR